MREQHVHPLKYMSCHKLDVASTGKTKKNFLAVGSGWFIVAWAYLEAAKTTNAAVKTTHEALATILLEIAAP